MMRPRATSRGDGEPSGRELRRGTGAIRGRRWPARAGLGAICVIGVVLVLTQAGTAYELALPSVRDAPVLVQRVLRAHHGQAGGVPVPAKLGASVVAVEDEHFYASTLVNVFGGAARAALATLHTNGDPGGSTISQQLAKQLYGDGRGFSATIEQIGLGVKLSFRFSKSQILAMYLNVVYYGNGFWGDDSAARGYFGSGPDRLDWAEAAMLAGLVQAPSAYDPERHLALAKLRQRQVLHQLVVNHDLTEAQAEAAYREPLPLREG